MPGSSTGWIASPFAVHHSGGSRIEQKLSTAIRRGRSRERKRDLSARRKAGKPLTDFQRWASSERVRSRSPIPPDQQVGPAAPRKQSPVSILVAPRRAERTAAGAYTSCSILQDRLIHWIARSSATVKPAQHRRTRKQAVTIAANKE
jgi:hypothetical protein